MTRDTWLATHPLLQPVAEVDALVGIAAAESCPPAGSIPDWDDYTADFLAGVPLLQSSKVAIDFSPPEEAVRAVITKLASSPLPDALKRQCRELEAELDPPVATDRLSPTHPGLLRYLAWAVMVRYLSPVVNAFDSWRNEERWLRNYCPTCGEPPAMAQLVGKDPWRLRKLSCGRCRTRWRYRRTGCTFCDVQDEHRLTVLAIEDQGGLRIDYCEGCGGYLKTYDGEGHENFLLADWTSLHLDMIARQRGLKRLAASLYVL